MRHEHVKRWQLVCRRSAHLRELHREGEVLCSTGSWQQEMTLMWGRQNARI